MSTVFSHGLKVFSSTGGNAKDVLQTNSCSGDNFEIVLVSNVF